MVGFGVYMLLMTGFAIWVSRKEDWGKHSIFLRVMIYSIPIPYLAGQLGWILAEVGRQPWAVYGVLKTVDGVSPALCTLQVAGSLFGFTVFYGGLGILNLFLMFKFARKGPDESVKNLLNITGRR